jgi:hypothetical protein
MNWFSEQSAIALAFTFRRCIIPKLELGETLQRWQQGHCWSASQQLITNCHYGMQQTESWCTDHRRTKGARKTTVCSLALVTLQNCDMHFLETARWKDTYIFNMIMQDLTMHTGLNWKVWLKSAPPSSLKSGFGPFTLQPVWALKDHRSQHDKNSPANNHAYKFPKHWNRLLLQHWAHPVLTELPGSFWGIRGIVTEHLQ